MSSSAPARDPTPREGLVLSKADWSSALVIPIRAAIVSRRPGHSPHTSVS
jgi:hypothetical protein